jgi:DNA-binding response OmpR family regulator
LPRDIVGEPFVDPETLGGEVMEPYSPRRQHQQQRSSGFDGSEDRLGQLAASVIDVVHWQWLTGYRGTDRSVGRIIQQEDLGDTFGRGSATIAGAVSRDGKGSDVHILIVEDETKLAATLRRGLEENGYAVDAVHDGADGLALAESAAFDGIVLDVMLPGVDGLAIARTLRDRHVATPILMLTARDAIDDRVAGLDAGADDYLVKPFALRELLARLRALTRRDLPGREPVLRVADLEIDAGRHEVRRAGQSIGLAGKEYAILEYLARNRNQVLTRDQIAEHVWDLSYDGESNVVDVYIRYLRRKLDEQFSPPLIYTVRGVGYQLREPP